ncbi:MAG: 5'-methylthioadenosine/S-adenosylhomocysteine nucleosidase [Chloroflexi bacterium]|nr:MAG: 5'-methylthioadenosine/S-adenosylhomocysteine nucleosidase [Chloroflexota bacterium]
MNIDNTQMEQLCAAFVSAFPTRQDLEMMVFYQLNENLSSIVREDNLEKIVFELTKWAMTKGRLEELVSGACKQNRGNPQLRNIAEQLRSNNDQHPPRGSGSITVTANHGSMAANTGQGDIQQQMDGQARHSHGKAQRRSDRQPEQLRPTIGLLTALPKEYAAMSVLLDNTVKFTPPEERTSHPYTLGEIPVTGGGKLHVVLALLPTIGLTLAATRATRLLEHFPAVQELIMVGIAGGVPDPERATEHVRLGDIVVSDQYGVVEYDFITRMTSETIYRPWLAWIEQAMARLNVTRPPKKTDILASFATEPPSRLTHPSDPQRIVDEPRVFLAPIASSNTLLKDPVLRDELRVRYGVKAIEMEGAGVADATWDPKAGYLVVRGICDYCDANKNDKWHSYAAIVAAAYTRALLASLPAAGGGLVE